jgi:hypothetical protein
MNNESHLENNNSKENINDKIKLFNLLYPKLEYNYEYKRISPRYKLISFIHKDPNLIKNLK